MKKLLMALVVMGFISSAASADELGQDEGLALNSSDTIVDTLESDNTLDSFSFDKNRYVCVALPYGYHEKYYGDGWSIYQAKHEALSRCQRSSHKHCYIKACRKVHS